MIRVGDEERPVRPGTMVYVAAQVPHQFFDITEDLSILVFFAPEHTPSGAD
jgi:mannose-6-phosphate isomerase-like protein (cupin superfamily)